jgi:hypothetical protein
MNAQNLQKGELDEEMQAKINFITFIITMFARAFKMSRQNAYLYLKKYGGLDYIFRHWWTLHVEDPYWSVKALYTVCHKNGGAK